MLNVLFICWKGFKAYRERLIKIHTVQQYKIYFKEVRKNESKEKNKAKNIRWGQERDSYSKFMPWNSTLLLEDSNKFCSLFFINQCKGEKYNQLCPAEGRVLYILLYEYMDMYLIANCFLKEGSFIMIIKNGDYISNVHLWQVSLYQSLK